MMPAKVHWELDVSMSLDAPYSDTSSQSFASTSSLQYINAQLVAHGFAGAPGLVLDGLSNTDSERVVKCLMGMLGQRINDMARTEELTTKLRTLSYDHERLSSMHRAVSERAANAEREMNLHKSRLNAVNRTLQTTEAAHKHTTAELQRTRTSLQAVRAAHLAELKKKEAQVERMAERWSRLADAQLKLATVPAGLRCANVSAVDGLEIRETGPTFLEVALQEAENARAQLSEENSGLRHTILRAVNEIQSVLHAGRSPAAEGDEEPVPFTLTTLFPLAPIGFSDEKLSSILSSLRAAISRLSHSPPPSPKAPVTVKAIPDGEVERLEAIITSLREEIALAQTSSAATHALVAEFAQDPRLCAESTGDISVDLMIAPAADAERVRLDGIKKGLDDERQKFTEAAVRLGQERAALEAERLRFLDEKRSWAVEQMLAELPPTPAPAVPSPPPPRSPRKSPVKVAARRTRVFRRPSLASPTKVRVEPSYQTEVPPPRASVALLPTFELPPPSPQTSLPAHPAFPSSLDLPTVPSSLSTTTPLEAPTPPALAPIPVLAPAPAAPPPITPRVFPASRPFVARAMHAYSPAKPSPLSRILMLAHSPVSPDPPLASLREEDETEADDAASEDPATLFPALPPLPPRPESPLREKAVVRNGPAPPQARLSAGEKSKGRAVAPVRVPGEKENEAKVGKAAVAGAKGAAPTMVIAKAGTGKAGAMSASRARLMAKVPPPPKVGKGGPRRVPVDSVEAPPAGRGWRG